MSRDYPTEGEQITEALLAIDSTIDEGFSDVCRNLDLIREALQTSLKSITTELQGIKKVIPPETII